MPISGACVGVVVGAGATVPVAIVGATTVVGGRRGLGRDGDGGGLRDGDGGLCLRGRRLGRWLLAGGGRHSNGFRGFWLVDVPIVGCRILQRGGENVGLLEQREGAVCVATGAGVVGLLEGGGELHHGGVVAKQ
ncbi:hypothetical protein [Corynebacterium pyruviciproducens]|uniref:hypothetical protein n=1 Tax=Corynebacterium pyruviciproducens TaxID=598660 RepID=UPI001FE00A24|nr:hypothetical protein [Corynebacterium pyruviciproducens]